MRHSGEDGKANGETEAGRRCEMRKEDRKVRKKKAENWGSGKRAAEKCRALIHTTPLEFLHRKKIFFLFLVELKQEMENVLCLDAVKSGLNPSLQKSAVRFGSNSGVYGNIKKLVS